MENFGVGYCGDGIVSGGYEEGGRASGVGKGGGSLDVGYPGVFEVADGVVGVAGG